MVKGDLKSGIQATRWEEFNINDYVKVKLTKYGRVFHRNSHEELNKTLGHTFVYHAPKEDNEGWSEWQAWDLIKTFGDAIIFGKDVPFETIIKIRLSPDVAAPALSGGNKND